MNTFKSYFVGVSMLALFLAIAVSCARETIDPTNADPKVQASGECPSRADFIGTKTYQEYLTAYRLLPTADRMCMWLDKLDHTLQFFSNQAQLDFINNAGDALTLTLFEEGSPEGYDEAFMTDAQVHFTQEQVADIFMVLHDYDSSPLPLRPNSSGSNDCECSWSIYCGLAGTCDGGCDSVGGCGMWGTSKCDGICDNPLY